MGPVYKKRDHADTMRDTSTWHMALARRLLVNNVELISIRKYIHMGSGQFTLKFSLRNLKGTGCPWIRILTERRCETPAVAERYGRRDRPGAEQRLVLSVAKIVLMRRHQITVEAKSCTLL